MWINIFQIKLPDRSARKKNTANHKACVQNLRIVVSLNPSNPEYRSRVQSNPALLTHSAVQWMDSWSPEAIAAVGRHICEPAPPANNASGANENANAAVVRPTPASGITAELQCMHSIALDNALASPRHFVTLARQYLSIVCAKREYITSQVAFLQGAATPQWRYSTRCICNNEPYFSEFKYIFLGYFAPVNQYFW